MFRFLRRAALPVNVYDQIFHVFLSIGTIGATPSDGSRQSYHQDCRWDVMQPESGTEKIQNGEYRERHRDEEKHALKQRDVPPEHKIADPYGVVQKKKSHGRGKTTCSGRLPAFGLPEMSPPADKQCGWPAPQSSTQRVTGLRRLGLTRRRKGGIDKVDEHGKRKNHEPDPRKRYLQIHRRTPAFTENSGSFVGFP